MKALVIVLPVLLVGCGGSTPSAPTATVPTSQPPASTPSPTQPPPVAASLIELSVACQMPTIPYREGTDQCQATGIYSDKTRTLLTSGVTWQSSNVRQATVDSTGLVTSIAVEAADVSITATSQDVSGSASIHVTGCGIIVPSFCG